MIGNALTRPHSYTPIRRVLRSVIRTKLYAAGRLMQVVPLRMTGLPLLLRILGPNAALVAVAIVSGVWFGVEHIAIDPDDEMQWDFAVWFGASMLPAFVLVNYALLRATLRPLSELSRLVSALQRGELHERAKVHPFADSSTSLIIQTANSLLDELAAYRRRIEDLVGRSTHQLEVERAKVSRELHDDIAQNLTALLVLQSLAASASANGERERALVEARELTRYALEGVRRMSLGLRPHMLDDLGLVGALKWYVAELLRGVLPEVELHLNGTTALPSTVALGMYRIAQEALSNVIRHADASKVRIFLGEDSGTVVLRIEDDGVGFRPDHACSLGREHLGLLTMKERARLVGGEAKVTSRPRGGTTVEVRVPVQLDADAGNY